MIIALYVDYLLIGGNNSNLIAWIKSELSKQFELKDLCEASTILETESVCDRKQRKLLLTQEKYSHKVLERFYMESTRPANTPMKEALDPTMRLEVEMNDFCNKSNTYRETIGSSMYLVMKNCPDISFAIKKLSNL